jgi:hypothetical protein
MSDFAALVLSLPTRNSTLRMRLWRALKQTGCGVLRDGVYLLPSSPANDEALARLEADIRAAGGFAMTLSLTAKAGAQLTALRKLFDRVADYESLLHEIRTAKASLTRLGARRSQTRIHRLERAQQKLAAIDFYAGGAKAQVEAALADLKGAYRAMFSGGEPRFSRRQSQRFDPARYQKRVWATRKAPWVDRLASAWLIKRFIDPDARFAWIDRPSECPKNAVGFDFDGAEFTHVGKRVTFEVLLSSFGLETDSALATIGAAVHFLDVGGIPVPDAKGLETMLKGAREKARSDDALLAEAMRTLDLLYSAYGIRDEGLSMRVPGSRPASKAIQRRP